MSYKNGNYSAFYVKPPFDESALGAHATKDFCYYSMLKAWKGADTTFPFNNSHDKTYNVRDDSDWESTLKPRLRTRLGNSKNIILFLSVRTISSLALKEEIVYGIKTLGLPVIVVYPDYSEKSDLLLNGSLKDEITKLWDNLPALRDSMSEVPNLHVPMNKETIRAALDDKGFMVNTKKAAGTFIYKA